MDTEGSLSVLCRCSFQGRDYITEIAFLLFLIAISWSRHSPYLHTLIQTSDKWSFILTLRQWQQLQMAQRQEDEMTLWVALGEKRKRKISLQGIFSTRMWSCKQQQKVCGTRCVLHFVTLCSILCYYHGLDLWWCLPVVVGHVPPCCTVCLDFVLLLQWHFLPISSKMTVCPSIHPCWREPGENLRTLHRKTPGPPWESNPGPPRTLQWALAT